MRGGPSACSIPPAATLPVTCGPCRSGRSPFGRYFEYKLERNGKEAPFRGVGYRMANGDILILSYNVNEIYGFKHLLLDAMAWGGIMVFGVGIAGAVITGLGAVRQINGITGAVERIVTGNLAERLPTRRGAGDLDRLVYLVNGMLDDIERLMREVKGVTDDIAHDLRTPLTRLLGGLERARRRTDFELRNMRAPSMRRSRRRRPFWVPSARCCALRRSRTGRGVPASRESTSGGLRPTSSNFTRRSPKSGACSFRSTRTRLR